MDAADYFTAIMPEPFQILGLRLRPFSLAHYQLLRRFGCAFVSETEAAATTPDLIFGVLACSMVPSEFLAWTITDDYESEVRIWGEKIGVVDVNAKAKLFKDYIEAHSVIPKYWEERSGGSSGAHWSQCVEVMLRSKLGWTTQDLETKPLSQAFADYFKHAENEGAVKLMTPDEIAFISEQKGLACVA
jgi:hypothetical protein